jgi:hypothetical protein
MTKDPTQGETVPVPLATGISEDLLTSHLFDGPLRLSLQWLLQFPRRPRIGYHIESPVIDPAPGLTNELDALIYMPSDPAQTVALECKRVTIKGSTGSIHSPGGLTKLRKASLQANRMAEIGFQRVYMAVLILVAAEAGDADSWGGGPLAPDLCAQVFDPKWVQDLRDDVGILYVQAGQQTGRNLFRAGATGILRHINAASRAQPDELTERIRTWSLAQPTPLYETLGFNLLSV